MATPKLNTQLKRNNLSHPVHGTYWKFSAWLVRTYGKGLHGKWKYISVPGSKMRLKYREFNKMQLSRRLVGHDVIIRIERYVKRYCPEIKIVPCDDIDYAGSILLLIPHPEHGISVMFVPQCTQLQNQFFLYSAHFKALTKALNQFKAVYKTTKP